MRERRCWDRASTEVGGWEGKREGGTEGEREGERREGGTRAREKERQRSWKRQQCYRYAHTHHIDTLTHTSSLTTLLALPRSPFISLHIHTHKRQQCDWRWGLCEYICASTCLYICIYGGSTEERRPWQRQHAYMCEYIYMHAYMCEYIYASTCLYL